MTAVASGDCFAFKEWSLICDVLGEGKQSLILRKGGIAEGKEGFSFNRGNSFYLFPTYFHEQNQQTNLNISEIPQPEEGVHTIRYRAEIESSGLLTDWEQVKKLQPFHFWKEETIRERFDWKQANAIHFAFVRVYKLNQPWILEDRASFNGCRSWIKVPQPPADIKDEPVLSDEEFQKLKDNLNLVK